MAFHVLAAKTHSFSNILGFTFFWLLYIDCQCSETCSLSIYLCFSSCEKWSKHCWLERNWKLRGLNCSYKWSSAVQHWTTGCSVWHSSDAWILCIYLLGRRQGSERCVITSILFQHCLCSITYLAAWKLLSIAFVKLLLQKEQVLWLAWILTWHMEFWVWLNTKRIICLWMDFFFQIHEVSHWKIQFSSVKWRC